MFYSHVVNSHRLDYGKTSCIDVIGLGFEDIFIGLLEKKKSGEEKRMRERRERERENFHSLFSLQMVGKAADKASPGQSQEPEAPPWSSVWVAGA